MRSLSKSTYLSRRLVRELKKAKVPGLELADDQYALLGFNPGWHAKSAGAWAWELVRLGNWTSLGYWPMRIGSSDRASSLKKGSKVEWYESHATGDIQVCIEPPKGEVK